MVPQWQWDFLIFVDQKIAIRGILVTIRTIKYGLYIGGDVWINDHFLRGDNGTGAMERNSLIPRRHLRKYVEQHQMGMTYSWVLPACRTKMVTVKPGEGYPRARTTIFLTFLRTWKFQNKKLKRERRKKSSLRIKNKSSPNSLFPTLLLQREKENETGRVSKLALLSEVLWLLHEDLFSRPLWDEKPREIKQWPELLCLLSALLWSCHKQQRKKDSVSIWPLSIGSADSGPKGQSERLLRLLLLNTQASRPLCDVVTEMGSWTLKSWRAAICSSPFRVGSESLLF